ncbi:MAG: hypothetical protein ACRD1Z_12820 [Vicinamibacteria bacterium]
MAKPVEKFHRNAVERDGRQVYCASCTAKYQREPERLREKKEYDGSPERQAFARESVKRSKRGNGRYSYAKSHAKEKSHAWELLREEYGEMVRRPCHYCGRRISETGIGLDRCDNGVGYVLGNVVPCCVLCNTIKSDKFTRTEMERIGETLRSIYVSRQGEAHV